MLDIRSLAAACIEEISKTLVTEQRAAALPEFDLDPSQRRLLETDARLVRLVAPAGSGKTQTLNAKAIDVLSRDPAARVLCLTFTNGAAEEFKARAARHPVTAGRDLSVSTVNAFGWNLVKESRPGLRIVDSKGYTYGAACAIIKKVLEENAYSFEGKPRYREILDFCDATKGLGFSHDSDRAAAQTWYSHLKTLRLTAVTDSSLEQLDMIQGSTEHSFHHLWFPLWKKLTAAFWDAKLLTLEDQKYWAQNLLESDKGCQARLRRYAYTHVMVDEFQDINYLDLFLICLAVRLMDAHLYIVGDDDQTIFEWRACTSHFIRMPDKFIAPLLGRKEGFESILLENNYRCPRNVVSHASSLIANNRERVPKQITAKRTDDANIRVVPLPAAYLSLQVVDELITSITEKHPRHRIAVLARKKCQLIPIHILLTKRGLPFHIARDLNVFLSPAFADFRTLMALPQQYVKQVGPIQTIESTFALLDKLYKYPVKKSEREELSVYLKGCSPNSLYEAVVALEGYTGQLKNGTGATNAAQKLHEFLVSGNSQGTVVDALKVASRHFVGFQQDFLKAKTDIFYADPPFSHLVDLSVGYDRDFAGFLRDIDRTQEDAEYRSSERQDVELMTALRAKGREFDTVIVLDTNDGIWPNDRARQDGRIEEERRLFYVAVTRCRNNLLLFVNRRIQGVPFEPSPFIGELRLPESAWMKDPKIEALSKQLMSTLKI